VQQFGAPERGLKPRDYILDFQDESCISTPSSLAILGSAGAGGSAWAARIEVRPAAGADGGFPSSDDLGALRPECPSALEIFEDRVFFTAIEENARHRRIQAILLDTLRPRRCCGF
jgi:hypothetical protein